MDVGINSDLISIRNAYFKRLDYIELLNGYYMLRASSLPKHCKRIGQMWNT